jgi:hypothetical protein
MRYALGICWKICRTVELMGMSSGVGYILNYWFGLFSMTQVFVILSRKPATIFKRVAVDAPYPREYGDLRLFEIEAGLTRDFLGMNQTFSGSE